MFVIERGFVGVWVCAQGAHQTQAERKVNVSLTTCHFTSPVHERPKVFFDHNELKNPRFGGSHVPWPSLSSFVSPLLRSCHQTAFCWILLEFNWQGQTEAGPYKEGSKRTKSDVCKASSFNLRVQIRLQVHLCLFVLVVTRWASICRILCSKYPFFLSFRRHPKIFKSDTPIISRFWRFLNERNLKGTNLVPEEIPDRGSAWVCPKLCRFRFSGPGQFLGSSVVNRVSTICLVYWLARSSQPEEEEVEELLEIAGSYTCVLGTSGTWRDLCMVLDSSLPLAWQVKGNKQLCSLRALFVDLSRLVRWPP